MTPDRPADDELEVTVLGKGVGESCVLHLGDQVWMIVDSFYDVDTGLPAAQAYLEEIDVDKDRVVAVCLTHLDQDHYRGFDDLHDHYDNAVLLTPSAVSSPHFRRLWADDADHGGLGWLPALIKSANRRSIRDGRFGHRPLSAGQGADLPGRLAVTALAPTDGAVAAANQELGQLLKTGDRDAVRSRLKDDNRTSVVLHCEGQDCAALLCGDLMTAPADLGWQALVDEGQRPRLVPRSRADLVKVAHHGSSRSDHPGIWTTLAADMPVLLVSPHRGSGLPTPDDVTRLLGVARELWQTAASTAMVPDGLGNMISAGTRTGVVRARRPFEATTWTVTAREPGWQVVA